jgi:tetratricopeptide (TPR) repeat protein
MACLAIRPLSERLGRVGELQENLSGTGHVRSRSTRWIDVAVPGGLRALAGDGLWLKLYMAWAARDLPRSEMLIRLVTVVDDRPLDFWINGARIIAYDMSEWRVSSPDDRTRMPAEVRRRIAEEQACSGLRHLESAFASHPDNAAIWVEMGNIQLYRRGDMASAAECYRRAAETPDAPFFAARIYGELLRRLGRNRDAYDWLRRVHARLPVDDEAAMSGLVLKRIHDLEKELDIPIPERYKYSVDKPRQ